MQVTENNTTVYDMLSVAEEDFRFIGDGLALLHRKLTTDLLEAEKLADKRPAEKVRLQIKKLENLRHDLKNVCEVEDAT